jgi:hypothetical protein
LPDTCYKIKFPEYINGPWVSDSMPTTVKKIFEMFRKHEDCYDNPFSAGFFPDSKSKHM